MQFYNLDKFLPGELANREDEVAKEILDRIAEVLRSDGEIKIKDCNNVLWSRVKYPINNLVARLNPLYHDHRPDYDHEEFDYRYGMKIPYFDLNLSKGNIFVIRL